MNAEKQKKSSHTEKGIYHAPREKAFDRVITPFEDFIHRQTTSGLLLIATAIIALLLMAKTGILFASLFAGVTGFIWLFLAGSKD